MLIINSINWIPTLWANVRDGLIENVCFPQQIPSPLSMSDRSTPLDFSPSVESAVRSSEESPRELTPKGGPQRPRTQSTTSSNASHKHLVADRPPAFMGTTFAGASNPDTNSHSPSTCTAVSNQFLAGRPSAEFIPEPSISLATNPPTNNTTRNETQTGHSHVNLDELRVRLSIDTWRHFRMKIIITITIEIALVFEWAITFECVWNDQWCTNTTFCCFSFAVFCTEWSFVQ